MLIILEGPDGSGKTTLLNKFLEKGFICKKCIRNERPDWSNILEISKITNIVVDRSFISDIVYRCVQGGEREDLMLRDAVKLLTYDTTIVHCKTKNMYGLSMERGEDNVTDAKTAKNISDTYDIFMKMFSKFTDCRIVTYDFRETNAFEKLLDIVNKEV